MERKKLTMKEKDTKVTKQETLAALRNPGELYVVMSGVTRQPFVVCDDETFDDEILLYYRVEDAKEKAKQLLDQKYLTAVAKLESKQLLPFYTSLYTIGVNALCVNSGTDTEIHLQLEELVIRKKPEEGKKIVENSAFHLTAIYFMQELRRGTDVGSSEKRQELQEEMLAHYMKGSFIIGIQENGQIPVLKQKDGSMFQPIFTDMIEFHKFSRGQKMKTAVVAAEKMAEVLASEAKGVVVNPFGVNVQLNVARKKPPVQS